MSAAYQLRVLHICSGTGFVMLPFYYSANHFHAWHPFFHSSRFELVTGGLFFTEKCSFQVWREKNPKFAISSRIFWSSLSHFLLFAFSLSHLEAITRSHTNTPTCSIIQCYCSHIEWWEKVNYQQWSQHCRTDSPSGVVFNTDHLQGESAVRKLV